MVGPIYRNHTPDDRMRPLYGSNHDFKIGELIFRSLSGLRLHQPPASSIAGAKQETDTVKYILSVSSVAPALDWIQLE